MSIHTIQVLGQGPVARELALAYRRFGATPSTAPTMTVIGGAVDKQMLNELEQSGALVAPSVEACRIAFDRSALRRTASEELGLPTLAYEYAETPEELGRAIASIGYPCVVKHGRDFVVLHGEGSDPGRVAMPAFVERYIEFDYEVTILTARSIDPATGELATWFCEPLGTRHDDNGELVEAWQPALLSETAMGNARSIAARITSALGCMGLFAIELFVDGEEVYFSQAHPVPGRDGLLTTVTQRFDQCELFARASLGLPIDVTLTTPGACHFTTAPNGITPEGLARALAVEETSVEVLGTRDHAVLVRSTAETVAQARERAERAAKALEI